MRPAAIVSGLVLQSRYTHWKKILPCVTSLKLMRYACTQQFETVCIARASPHKRDLYVAASAAIPIWVRMHPVRSRDWHDIQLVQLTELLCVLLAGSQSNHKAVP